MIINLDSITIDKPIPGLPWTPSRCSTLTDLLTALVTQVGSSQDVHASSGAYDPATEAIIITLSNNSTFAIPAAQLLPVVADGVTITGNGTAANQLTGYRVDYDPATGAMTISPPTGAPTVIVAQTALTETAIDTEGLAGAAGSTVTTQQLLDTLAHHATTPPTNAAGPNATIVNGVLNLPNPLPVANFVRTSKLGLTAGYSATPSSGTQAGNPLTYQWAAVARPGTTGTATPATPTAATTAITFSAPGQYDVTLTVTDANGNSASRTETINVNRILEVASPVETNNDYLATINAALAWKNANDPNNTYKILVRGNTSEAAMVGADRVHIHFQNGAAATFAGAAFTWTTAPVDFRMSADQANPYAPAIINNVAGTPITMDGLDATNLIIENLAIVSAGRCLNTNNVSNLYLRNVVTRTTGADPYNHAHTGGVNITLEHCTAIGTGIAFALIAAPGRANTMKLLHSYGEVTASPAAATLATLYVPGATATGITQDILVMGNTLINNGTGNNSAGVPRSVLINGGSVTAVVTGARFVNNTLIQNVVGNPVLRTQSGDASKNTIPLLGNQLLGGVAFSNCAPAPVTTTNSNDII